MHSVSFSFNLKRSIQKHKYNLHTFWATKQRQKVNETKIEQNFHWGYIEQDAILVFEIIFSRNKQIIRREIAVTWWMREERSDWTSRRRSSDPSSSSSSSSTSLHRSSSFFEKLRFFISKGFENLPPLLYLLLDTSLNGFLTVFDFDLSLSLSVLIYCERRAIFILYDFSLFGVVSHDSELHSTEFAEAKLGGLGRSVA